MKKAIETYCFGFTMLIFALFANVVAFAQDSANVTVNKTTTTSSSSNAVPADWYTAPWVWIVGAIVLILIIVAMTRGNKNTVASQTTRTTVTRTTEVDDNV